MFRHVFSYQLSLKLVQEPSRTTTLQGLIFQHLFTSSATIDPGHVVAVDLVIDLLDALITGLKGCTDCLVNNFLDFFLFGLLR